MAYLCPAGSAWRRLASDRHDWVDGDLLKSARSAAGVRYITPHGVRRTCASLLAALDVHPRVAMRILRHSKIAVTMEIYTEVPDQAAREALRRLGEQFDS